jgi:transcriptional regulator with XRE-family HTH domain
MHLYPFASKRYIELYGLPQSVDEVRQHRIIDQKAPQVEENVIPRLLNIPSIEGIVAFRTNTSTAHAYAIDLGMGIGALPTYVAALGTDLVPVDIGVRHQVDIWMTYHPDARSVRRVSVFIDWLRTLFDAKRYPWFADDFIHPRDLMGTPPPAEVKAAAPTLIAKQNQGRLTTRQRAPPTLPLLAPIPRYRTRNPTVRKLRFTVVNPRATTETWAGSVVGERCRMGMKSKTKSTTSHDIEVGQRIRARRMAQGMSQTELGNLLGVTFQQVQKYEKGVNRVGAGRLVRIGEALDVPVSFFFGGTDAGSEDTRAILGFLDTSYSLRLLRAFSRIPPGGVQRAVVDLVESIAPEKARAL